MQKPPEWGMPHEVASQHAGQVQGIAPSHALHAAGRAMWQQEHQHHLTQPAGDNGNDSSDSSTSQVASRQQAAGSKAQQQQHIGATLSQVPAVGTNLHVEERQVSAQPDVMPPSVTLNMLVMSKHEAADAVRALMKPLYAARLLDKAQFKAVAQAATHSLNDPQSDASKDVKQTVKDCLQTVGLGQAASEL